MFSCSDSCNRVPHQGGTAGFGLISHVVMILQRSVRSGLFSLRSIRKVLPQQTCPNRPPLGMKVVEVRIDADADKFQLRQRAARHEVKAATGSHDMTVVKSAITVVQIGSLVTAKAARPYMAVQ